MPPSPIAQSREKSGRGNWSGGEEARYGLSSALTKRRAVSASARCSSVRRSSKSGLIQRILGTISYRPSRPRRKTPRPFSSRRSACTASGSAGPERVDQHIGAREESVQRGPALRRLQVEESHLLASRRQAVVDAESV